MFAQVFRALDWLLTWAERIQNIPGGSAVLTAVSTGLVAVWAAVSDLPAVIVFVVIFCFCVAVIALQEHLYVFRRYLSPPIVVRIRGFGHVGLHESRKSAKDFFERTGMPASPTATLRAPIYILNRSTKRRVSLEIGAFTIQPRQGMPLSIVGGIDTGDLVLDLGPEEASRGSFEVKGIPEGYLDGAERIIVIEDVVSGRRARVSVPGKFPKRH